MSLYFSVMLMIKFLVFFVLILSFIGFFKFRINPLDVEKNVHNNHQNNKLFTQLIFSNENQNVTDTLRSLSFQSTNTNLTLIHNNLSTSPQTKVNPITIAPFFEKCSYSGVSVATITHLWLIDHKFYAFSVPGILDLPIEINCMFSTFWIFELPRDIDPWKNIEPQNIWNRTVSFIRYRVYPGAYAHDLRDTLAQELLLLQKFFPDFTPDTVRELYLDNTHVKHDITKILSNMLPLVSSVDQLPNMFFENAIVGYMPYPNVCLAADKDKKNWQFVSDYIGQRCNLTKSELQKIPGQIWFINRNVGVQREIVNHINISKALQQEFGINRVITQRPGMLSFCEQVKIARQSEVLVGPHGANLGAMILSGPNVKTLEVTAHIVNWWELQAQWQQSAFGRVMVDKHPSGEERSDADPDVVVHAIKNFTNINACEKYVTCYGPGQCN